MRKISKKIILYLLTIISLTFVPIIVNHFNSTHSIFFNSNKVLKTDFTIKKNKNDIPISSEYNNLLNNVEISNVNDVKINEAIKNTFIQNIDQFYENLNLDLSPDLSAAFSFNNKKIESNQNYGKIICDISVVDSTILKIPNNGSIDDYSFKNFSFTNFIAPIETSFIDTSLIKDASLKAPHEITSNDFFSYINFEFNKLPKNTIITPKWEIDNFAGEIIIKEITLNKYYNNQNYFPINSKKTILSNHIITGFRKAVLTDINNLEFPKSNNLKLTIKNYLINHHMAPLNYNENQIQIEFDNNDNNKVKVTFTSFYNHLGEWVTNSISSPQYIYLSNKTTSINDTIRSNSTLNNYSSPYEIKQRFLNNEDFIVINLKQLLINNLINYSLRPTLDQIEIISLIDTNLENNATLQVVFNLIDVGMSDGILVPNLTLTTTITNLIYRKTTFELKNINDLANKAADYIDENNWEKFINIKYPLYDTTYQFDNLNSDAINYCEGKGRVILIANKYVNNNGQIIENNKSEKIEITNFAKVPPTKYGWKDNKFIPFAIAANKEHIESYFVITNENDYKNILFKNDVRLLPSISNIQINAQSDEKNSLNFSFDINNFINSNGMKINTENKIYKDPSPSFSTLEGIKIIPSGGKINENNYYEYIYIQPLLRPFFNLDPIGGWDGNELRIKMNTKGYELKFENSNIVLYNINKNKKLGILSEYVEIKNDDGGLKGLTIGLIVSGIIGFIVVIVFIILFIFLHLKQHKKIKKNKQ